MSLNTMSIRAQLEKRLRHEILHKNEEGQRKQSSVKALLRKVKK